MEINMKEFAKRIDYGKEFDVLMLHYEKQYGPNCVSLRDFLRLVKEDAEKGIVITIPE